MEDNHSIFRCLCKFSLCEKIGVQTRCEELLDVGLIELSNMKVACVMVMPSRKDIFSIWMEKRMCGEYLHVKKKTILNHYLMPILEELFDEVGIAQVFKTLDLRSDCHIDDVIISSNTPQKHVKHLQSIFERLCE